MICKTLISFAKQRERAYQLTGTFTAPRAEAISHIKRVADHWKGKNEQAAIRQAAEQIREILPPAQSRYHHQREKILTLLSENL